MSDIQTERITGAKLLRKSEEEKRTVFFFEKDGKEMKYSAFEPNVPELVLGKFYDFTASHKPMGDGKYYHNLTRKSKNGKYQKDGEYDIVESSPVIPAPMEGKPDLPPGFKTADQMPMPSIYGDMRDARIHGEAMLKLAVRVVTADGSTTITDVKMKEIERLVDEFDHLFEKFVTKKCAETGR